MKTCTGCGETRPLEQFHKDKSKASGRRSRCKPCLLAYRSEYLARPEIKARVIENRGITRERNSVYYATNREAILAQKTEYYAADRERILAQKAERYAQPDVKAQKTEYNAEHYAANREARLEYQAEYAANNPHVAWEVTYRRRARKHGFEPIVESFTKEQLIDRWGSGCWHCGGDFEELDHYEVPVFKGGPHTLESCRPSCILCNRKSWREDFTPTRR